MTSFKTNTGICQTPINAKAQAVKPAEVVSSLLFYWKKKTGWFALEMVFYGTLLKKKKHKRCFLALKFIIINFHS